MPSGKALLEGWHSRGTLQRAPTSKDMRHVITALVENKVGVLARIVGLFTSRGFNIDSLTVGETENPELSRLTVVVKVNVPPGKRGEILEIVDVFRGKIIDVGQKDLIIELSGTEDKLEAMIKLLHTYGIKEMARTGQIAMARGTKQ